MATSCERSATKTAIRPTASAPLSAQLSPHSSERHYWAAAPLLGAIEYVAVTLAEPDQHILFARAAAATPVISIVTARSVLLARSSSSHHADRRLRFRHNKRLLQT
jgi:hypothetical protein